MKVRLDIVVTQRSASLKLSGQGEEKRKMHVLFYKVGINSFGRMRIFYLVCVINHL